MILRIGANSTFLQGENPLLYYNEATEFLNNFINRVESGRCDNHLASRNMRNCFDTQIKTKA